MNYRAILTGFSNRLQLLEVRARRGSSPCSTSRTKAQAPSAARRLRGRTICSLNLLEKKAWKIRNLTAVKPNTNTNGPRGQVFKNGRNDSKTYKSSTRKKSFILGGQKDSVTECECSARENRQNRQADTVTLPDRQTDRLTDGHRPTDRQTD
jgi:hypothetical protein